MDLSNPIFRTVADTLGTSAVITGAVPQAAIEQSQFVQGIGTDWKAPVIALASSVIIQLVLKGLNWISKKVSPKQTTPPLTQ